MNCGCTKLDPYECADARCQDDYGDDCEPCYCPCHDGYTDVVYDEDPAGADEPV